MREQHHQKSLPKLIIVNGLPASGKTTLAESLSRDLHIPMFNKDGLKEILSDSMGVVSAQGSRRFNSPSLAILLHTAKMLLAHGCSVIIESNFKSTKDVEELVKQIRKNGIVVVEIFCRADGELLVERFRKRLEKRHSIHPRIMPAHFLKELRENQLEPLTVGETLLVDTSDFSKIPYKKILEFIKK